MTGKPRSGPVFDKRQKARVQYRKSIRKYETQSTMFYSNDPHDALLRKNGTAFWKCRRFNFEPADRCSEVEDCVDSDIIAQNKYINK